MENVKSIVNKELESVRVELRNIAINNAEVNSELSRFLNSGSKMIRSVLGILYVKAFSQSISENVIRILTAGEIIHNASLLHDDVLDCAEQRRGSAPFYKLFTPNVAILTGDYLLSYATKNLIEIRNFEVLDIFRKCTQKMSEVEISQYFLRGKTPSEAEYIEICEGKTAVLFESILESLALVCDLPIDNAHDFGKNFGILFQIKNDLEQVSASNDRQNGVKTACDIFGVEKTRCLIDNYKSELRRGLENIPNNIYKQGLEDLLDKL